MHLTVRFIGHVPEGRVPAVLDALKAPFPLPPFDVELGPSGVFPRSGPPRVVWLGLAEGLLSLSAMHDQCNRRLLPLGFEPEKRSFSAHMTLARITDGVAGLIRGVIAQTASPPVRFHVTEATVFQSLLSPRGARHEALLRVPLEG